jgi:hypothetical protein
MSAKSPAVPNPARLRWFPQSRALADNPLSQLCYMERSVIAPWRLPDPAALSCSRLVLFLIGTDFDRRAVATLRCLYPSGLAFGASGVACHRSRRSNVMLTTVLSVALLLGLPVGMAAFLCCFFSGGTEVAGFISTFLAMLGVTTIAGAAVLFNGLSTMRMHIN